MKLRGGMMPPQGMPRPDAATLDAFATSLERTIDDRGAPLARPGPQARPSSESHRVRQRGSRPARSRHRRHELLPADDESHGFDNIAGVLARLAVAAGAVPGGGAHDQQPRGRHRHRCRSAQPTACRPTTRQEDHVEGLPLGTRGGLLFTHNFPQDAEYEFSVLPASQHRRLHDGPGVRRISSRSRSTASACSSPRSAAKRTIARRTSNMSETADKIDERLKTQRPVKAGPHMVGVTFIKRNRAESDEPLQPHERDHDLQDMNGLPLIDSRQRDAVRSTRPVLATRRAVAASSPVSPRQAGQAARGEAACARTILTTLARRAYRRPVTSADMEPILGALRRRARRRARSTTASSRACAWSWRTRSSCSAPETAPVGADGRRR